MCVTAALLVCCTNNFSAVKDLNRFDEFPVGITENLRLVYSDSAHIYADYGIYFPKTEIIDLQGNVVISDSTGTQLNTQQLYWDSGQEWLFTEKNFTFTSKDYDLEATQLDANRSFTKLMTGVLRGTVQVQEDEL